MDSLRIGGAEKSLITILNLLDYSKYDVDLYLLNHSGEFYNMIPKQVNVLDEDKKYKVFINNRKKAVFKYLAKFDIKSAFYTLVWLIGVLCSRITKQKLYIGWSCIKKLLKPIDKDYDVSIAFLERKTVYFNIDKVYSDKKICFIHNDYSKYPYNYKLDKKYFNYYDKIATVSDNCKDALINIFPEYEEKFFVIKNMVSKDLISKLSKEKIKNYVIDDKYTNIVSVGRLAYQKGFDISIEICNKLIKKGLKVRWYTIGEGEERQKLEQDIKKYNLEECFILVGADSNPYKWMKKADIYVQSSRFEGHSVTMMEAKKIEKVIIASDIPDFREQLKGDKGIIAKNVDDYYRTIKRYINNKNSFKKYIDNLKNENKKDNLEELNKLTRLIDEDL